MGFGQVAKKEDVETVMVKQSAQASVRMEFDSPLDTTSFVRSFVSLCFGGAPALLITSRSRAVRDDLDVHEISERLDCDLVEEIAAVFEMARCKVELRIRLHPEHPNVLTIELPVRSGRWTDRAWLQCDVAVITAVPSLALPTRGESFAYDAIHSLVGLALKTSGFRSATMACEGFTEHVQWRPGDKPSDEYIALTSEHADTSWFLTNDNSAPVEAWCRLPEALLQRPKPDEEWWATFDQLAAAPINSLPELRRHLAEVFDIPFDWGLEALQNVKEVVLDVVTPENGVTGRIVPLDTMVVIAIDFEQPPQQLAATLLHLCAHCEMGHVIPGDDFGHWDTHDTVSSRPAHRHWDRVVTELLEEDFRRPDRRIVESIEECTPVEKAWLVLNAHIGRMIGEARTLHPKAGQYQSAAYQRQAAQRITTQLEEYGGAMLCDGVGLGKTYVATTVMVHYANAWRDRLAEISRSSADDPFRMTILAPNSVVSTWQREAIPPLAKHGVAPATVRVLSHTKLSRILPTSEILQSVPGELSDMEHLLLSDLVIVDEAHNFRSVSARRTVVLRDLLRLQPRKDLRRKVLLLTATPVNNSLEDLRQQASLLFSTPLWFNENLTADGYRGRVLKDVSERTERAQSKTSDVAGILIHGSATARFSSGISFRDDLSFGPAVARIGDYLKEQEKLLKEQQDVVRATMLGEMTQIEQPATRVASEFLDRIVVQRSRNLCKQIEREQGSNVKLLFRPDAAPPERLVYEDVYDDTRDVLARFLPLFDSDASRGGEALSLKVYMWSDVRDGIRDAGETSSVVGLQRVLVLKRLESSPVAFLITMLRLLALYAHRLSLLLSLCYDLGDRSRARQLSDALTAHLETLDDVARERIDLLLTGEVSTCGTRELLDRWSKAHIDSRPAAGSDDITVPQLELFERDDDESGELREKLKRLWGLQEDLEQDFDTLLQVAPGLADIVFGRFDREDWPRRFIAGGSSIDWPTTASWGLRIVTDAKLRRLVGRLLRARRRGEKCLVFSQFTDTLAYIESVLRATEALGRNEWRLVVQTLSPDVAEKITEGDVRELAGRTAVVSGETEERDSTINAFAPYYRVGPAKPPGEATEWMADWRRAIEQPVDVLLASDVLAEGVNLQDASLLVNYDVHWNPVRMIQRAGRVDRRLNPTIEEAESFPDLKRLSTKLGKSVPQYWWFTHPEAAPVTVNLLLPDELEAELQLRERIANKTLAIDFTLGLEQGTGAEAEWMADYRYKGVSALNVWQRDRAIERVAGFQERLKKLFGERGIKPEWLKEWNGWLREVADDYPSHVLAWARVGARSTDIRECTRYLRPAIVDDTPHWLWTTEKPLDSVLNFWIEQDGKTFPPGLRKDITWEMDASRPVSAEDLLGAAVRLVERDDMEVEELGREAGMAIAQVATTISAGSLHDEVDRRNIKVQGFHMLQLLALDPGHSDPRTRVSRRGIARSCSVCGHEPGMHKCCPSCGRSVDGEQDIQEKFGFRQMRSANGALYEVPQPWCTDCRLKSLTLGGNGE